MSTDRTTIAKAHGFASWADVEITARLTESSLYRQAMADGQARLASAIERKALFAGELVQLVQDYVPYAEMIEKEIAKGGHDYARVEAQVSAPVVQSPAGSENREVVTCDREPGRGKSPASIADRPQWVNHDGSIMTEAQKLTYALKLIREHSAHRYLGFDGDGDVQMVVVAPSHELMAAYRAVTEDR